MSTAPIFDWDRKISRSKLPAPGTQKTARCQGVLRSSLISFREMKAWGAYSAYRAAEGQSLNHDSFGLGLLREQSEITRLNLEIAIPLFFG